MRTIALFGGTFDPVHNGHIKTSLNIQAHFNFDSYLFLPCKTPTIKPAAMATNQQRIDMLELAIKPYSAFHIDLRELKRDSPSYMVETLKSVRDEHKNASITLIMGYDAFLSLPKWHQWHKLIKLANILVINREDFSSEPVSAKLSELLEHHKKQFKKDIVQNQSGNIMFFNAGNYEISSTKLRALLKNHEEVNNELPKEVADYINLWRLYQ